MMKGNRSSYRTCPACRRRPRAASKPLLSAVLGCGLLVAACHSQPTPGNPAEPTQGSTGRSGPDREETPSARAGSTPAGCTATVNAKTQNIDSEDSPVKPWRKPSGQELVVEFERGRLSDRYAGLVAEAAAIWSKSPCLNAVPVQACSSGANCVAIDEDGSRSRGTDGEMEWDGSGAYMESASITLYTRLLARASDNGALATIVHEMGHALGLDHRLERSDVMNSVTSDNTNPLPDAVDFANLAAVYGS
jgi:hypothetical protein